MDLITDPLCILKDYELKGNTDNLEVFILDEAFKGAVIFYHVPFFPATKGMNLPRAAKQAGSRI